jgi:hypothetical protein
VGIVPAWNAWPGNFDCNWVTTSFKGGRMKEIFLEYAKKGVMTKAELAGVLGVPCSKIDSLRRQRVIPTVPHLSRPFKFDPLEMIRVFCDPSKQVRSLTTEKRSSGGKPKQEVFNVCKI